MDAVKIPTSLDWDKQKGTLAKVKAAQPVKDSLDKVQRAHESTDWSAFAAEKLGTPAEAEKRLADLEREAKVSLKLLSDKASEAEKAAKKACEEAKKDKTAADAAKALEAMAKAAAQLQKDVADFIDSARKEVQAELDKLAKAASKDKKAQPEPGAKPAITKEYKFIRSKILDCFRKIKAPAPNAKPWRFLVVKGPQTVSVCFLQTTPGNAHANMLKTMMPGEKVQIIKDPKGEVIWEKKAVTIVTVAPMSGVAKKLQLWLKKLTNINVKVRVRKPTGETVEEGDEGDDLPDDIKIDPAEAAEAAAAGKEFTKRLAALAAQIKKAMANPALPAESKAEIKALIDSIGNNGKAQKFVEANDDLDQLEALLKEEPPEAASGGGLSVKQLAEARLAWKKERETAVKEIKRLAEAIAREFASEKDQIPQVKKAVTDLYSLADKSLKVDLDDHLDAALNASDDAKRAQAVATAKRTLQAIRSLLDTNPVLKEIDGNEVIPGMSVVAPMKQSLDAVEAALG